jgi:hypothetical protein
MNDTMLSVFDFEYYFNTILSTASEVTIEISERKNVDSARALRSMQEIDDAILQAMMFKNAPLNLSMQTISGLDNLVQVLDDTYNLVNKIYSQKAN